VRRLLKTLWWFTRETIRPVPQWSDVVNLVVLVLALLGVSVLGGALTGSEESITWWPDGWFAVLGAFAVLVTWAGLRLTYERVQSDEVRLSRVTLKPKALLDFEQLAVRITNEGLAGTLRATLSSTVAGAGDDD